MKYIEKNYGHWQLKGNVKRLLLECKAKESTRYAINGIHISKDALVSCDGRHLVELRCNHSIPEGNYFCTSDGFLLDVLEGGFPKYESIFPEKSTQKKIVETTTEDGEKIIGLILGELCHSGCIIKLNLYKEPINILSELIKGKCRVFVNKNTPEHSPFIIEAETSIGNLRYIQMPINVENEA